jgi:hypothetical protein
MAREISHVQLDEQEGCQVDLGKWRVLESREKTTSFMPDVEDEPSYGVNARKGSMENGLSSMIPRFIVSVR